MATLRDIAKETGYGLGTISRAINGSGYVSDDKKAEILRVAELLNYNIKKDEASSNSIISQSCNCVGVLLTDITFPFFSRYLQDLQLELSRLGYQVMYFSEKNDSHCVEKVIALLNSRILCGLIFNVNLTTQEIDALRSYPVVAFERLVGGTIPMIASGHKKGGHMAARILLENRCINVLILSEHKSTPVYADIRIQECQTCLSKKHVKVTKLERSEAEASYHQLEQWTDSIFTHYPDVDGIFADDVTAYYCLMQAKKRSISVPHQLKILGYDGNDITRMVFPRITTLYQNVGKLASVSASVLHQLIIGKSVDARYYVEVKFQQGDTTL